MWDAYTFCGLICSQWLSIVLVTVLILLSIWIFASRLPGFLKVVGPGILLWCAVLSAQHIWLNYYLLMLGDESDRKAELGFDYLETRLSNKRLIHLVSAGRQDGNEQFYLALMAAQRGLHIPNALLSSGPGFMKGNKYSPFGSSIHYPVSYETFLLSYMIWTNSSHTVTEASTPNGSNVVHAAEVDAKTNDKTNRLPVASELVATNGDARSNLLAVWRSTNSTPEQAVNALNKWMPKDATLVSGPDLLGRNYEMSHFFGVSMSSLDANAQTNSGFDLFEMKYHLIRGAVTLRFSRHGDSSDFYFKNAFVSDTANY